MRWKTREHDDWRHAFAWLPVNAGKVTLWLEHYVWRPYQNGGATTNIQYEFATYGVDKIDVHPIGAR